jgi:hypothetical protein
MATKSAPKASLVKAVAAVKAKNAANPWGGIGWALPPSPGTGGATNPLQTQQNNTPWSYAATGQNYQQANVNQSGQNQQTVATNPAQNPVNNAWNGLLSWQNVQQWVVQQQEWQNLSVQPEITSNQQPQNKAVETKPTIVSDPAQKPPTKALNPKVTPGTPENTMILTKGLQGMNKNWGLTNQKQDGYRKQIGYDTMHPEQQKAADQYYQTHQDNLNSDDALDAMLAGQNMNVEHPQVQFAQKRLQNLRNYSTMQPNELAGFMKDGKIMGSGLMDLQKHYPQLYQQAMEARKADVKKDQSSHTANITSQVLNANYNKNKRFKPEESKPVTQYTDTINKFTENAIRNSNDPQGAMKTTQEFINNNPALIQAYKELSELQWTINVNNKKKESLAFQNVGKQNDMSWGQTSAIISNQSFELDLDSFNAANKAIMLQWTIAWIMKPYEQMMAAMKEDRSYWLQKEDNQLAREQFGFTKEKYQQDYLYTEKKDQRDYERNIINDDRKYLLEKQQLAQQGKDLQKVTNADGSESLMVYDKASGKIMPLQMPQSNNANSSNVANNATLQNYIQQCIDTWNGKYWSW